MLKISSIISVCKSSAVLFQHKCNFYVAKPTLADCGNYKVFAVLHAEYKNPKTGMAKGLKGGVIVGILLKEKQIEGVVFGMSQITQLSIRLISTSFLPHQ